MHISAIGQSTLMSSAKVLRLNQLLHIPSVTKNLLSVSQFAKDNDVFFEYTIPNKITDDTIITVGMFLDPRSFLGRDSECND